MADKILKTENEQWGFYGTLFNHYDEHETQAKWNEAFKTLQEMSGKKAEEIREFLDSRDGRHLADYCLDSDDTVKETIRKNYFNWIEKNIFEDKTKIVKIKDRTFFGTKVLNDITGKEDIILYTYQNKNRIYQEYATCIDKNENIYDIGFNYLTPIEE